VRCGSLHSWGPRSLSSERELPTGLSAVRACPQAMARLTACRAPFDLSASALERIQVKHTVYCERYSHDVSVEPHEAFVRVPKNGTVGPPRWFWIKWIDRTTDTWTGDVGSAPAQNTRPFKPETPYVIPENDLVDGPKKPAPT